MRDDIWMKYTTYSCRAEAEAFESGQYFADLEAKEEAKRQKEKETIDGVMDVLGLTGKCRECAWISELAEGFLFRDQISGEQLDYLEHICKLCGGKGTGVIPEKHEEWINNDWNDRLEWAKMVLPRYSCAWCPTAFRIYGQYKDPDDEWNAIDSPGGCANCKYFEESCEED